MKKIGIDRTHETTNHGSIQIDIIWYYDISISAFDLLNKKKSNLQEFHWILRTSEAEFRRLGTRWTHLGWTNNANGGKDLRSEKSVGFQRLVQDFASIHNMSPEGGQCWCDMMWCSDLRSFNGAKFESLAWLNPTWNHSKAKESQTSLNLSCGFPVEPIKLANNHGLCWRYQTTGWGTQES